MQRFKSSRQAQDFLSAHAFIYGHFHPADINSQPLTTATSGRRPSMSGSNKRAPKTQHDRLVTMIFTVMPSALGQRDNAVA
jgi:hypothetical protein